LVTAEEFLAMTDEVQQMHRRRSVFGGKDIMSKQQREQLQTVEACEKVLADLTRDREGLVTKAASWAEQCRSFSYAAFAQHDPEARRSLDAATAEAGKVAGLLASIDHAIATAQGKLSESRAAKAREERRREIKERQQFSKQVRELGPFMDKAVRDLARGLVALKQHAPAVGRSYQHVATLYRVLSVAFADTPFRGAEIGYPDANDRRAFSSFDTVISGWCDGADAALAHELAALGDSEQTTDKTEAAA
jgi:hypothetical protein